MDEAALRHSYRFTNLLEPAGTTQIKRAESLRPGPDKMTDLFKSVCDATDTGHQFPHSLLAPKQSLGRNARFRFQNAFDAVADEPGERWERLDVAVRENALLFSVTDSGPGVPGELKIRIMEPFFTTKDVGKGTGLGLSLSTAIAEEHGGKLELTDEAGHTCFCLTLPIISEKRQYAVK